MDISIPDGFFAHSPNDRGHGVWEFLRDHLRHVAHRAGAFAAPFGAEQQAFAAGLLHDLGKYADQFRSRLRNAAPSRDHWSQGAAVALEALKQPWGLAPALVIAGHHVGLDKIMRRNDLLTKLATNFQRRGDEYTDADPKRLVNRFTGDGFTRPQVSAGLALDSDYCAANMLDVRMLFSALVDADFLETEAHFDGDAARPRRPRPDGPGLDVDRAIAALDAHVAGLPPGESTRMSALRQQLWNDCTQAGAWPPGLFALSAPTGAGKTLAMLGFALRHAKAHGLRRIVVVLPYLNIIDQTVQVYRNVFQNFPEHFVLEHHSLADREAGGADGDAVSDAERQRRLMAENWDAPIVITTSVQALESLHADRPGRCRKLHRLARSVILFDEVQTLPPKLAALTLATFARLTDPAGPFGASLVMATATQPAFEALGDRVLAESGVAWQPRDLASDSASMFAAAAARVHVAWRHSASIELAALADELARPENARVLCIVNLKRHAVEVAQALQAHCGAEVLHLSTSMCPAHRQQVLAEVTRRLDLKNPPNQPVRLVSTQCVEAGVDLSFPVVYRALGPLDAIAQAAGRCNRHGEGPTGRVTVFRPRDERSPYPPGYGEAARAAEAFLSALSAAGHALDELEIINHPERLREYFRSLYTQTGRIDGSHSDEQPLKGALEACDFAEVAQHYKLIEQDAINVLVPFDTAAFARLRDELGALDRTAPGALRAWLRRAAPHAVSLFRPSDRSTFWRHVEPVGFSASREASIAQSQWFLPLPGFTYDRLLGYLPASDEPLVF